MPRSSFFIKVVNVGPDLTRKDFDLEHGIWSSGPDGGGLVPPERIPRRSRAYWESEASDELTGTQGHAIYGSDAGDVGFFWDARLIGGNSFRVDHSRGIQASWDVISDMNVAVTITLIDF